MLALERESKGSDPSVYLTHGDLGKPEQRSWKIIDALLANKFENGIKGKIVLKESCMEFSVNREVVTSLPHEMYDLTIDYLDIVSVSRL
jgi:hypothetical protein